MYKLKKVTVVAFVIGAMGAVSDLFEKYTGKLNVTIRLEMIQKAALLGTAGLLRKFWLFMGSNLRTVFGTSGTRLLLAPKGNLPGNGNLLSLRFHNIIIIIITSEMLCPLIATYVTNTYRVPTRLLVVVGREFKSAEGTTQGDPLAMSMYVISLQLLISLPS